MSDNAKMTWASSASAIWRTVFIDILAKIIQFSRREESSSHINHYIVSIDLFIDARPSKYMWRSVGLPSLSNAGKAKAAVRAAAFASVRPKKRKQAKPGRKGSQNFSKASDDTADSSDASKDDGVVESKQSEGEDQDGDDSNNDTKKGRSKSWRRSFSTK